MEEENTAVKDCLGALWKILQQYGESEWRKMIPEGILQVLGLKEGLDSYEENQTHTFQNLKNDVDICLKHLQTESVAHEKEFNQLLSVPLLGGTLISGREKDVLPERNQLVEVISENEVTCSERKPYTIFREFETLEEQIEAEKNIISKTDESMLSPIRTDETFFQTKTGDRNMQRAAIFVVVPIIQWKPKQSDVSLTGRAVGVLQKIENNMISNRSKAEFICKSFFESFGSHLYLDLIQLGGIFEIEIVYKEINECQSKEMRKKFINHVLKTKHFCRLECLETDTGISNDGVSDEFELISTKAYQYGGAQQIHYFPLWQKTLPECQQFLTVVSKERSNKENFIGVWTLIEQQFETFGNSENLADFVADEWMNLVDQNDDRCFKESIATWKDNFLQKREELANQSTPKFDDLQTLLDQLNEGESKFGYIPVKNALKEGEKYLLPILRKIMEINSQASKKENHSLWHGILKVAKKYRHSTDGLSKEIFSWLQKYMFTDFVLLPCPFQDVKSSYFSLEKTLLPAIKKILKGNLCIAEQEEKFFQSVTMTVQKTVSSALNNLLSAGNTEQYLVMFSDALILGYDIGTYLIKDTLTMEMLQEYTMRCKKSLKYLEANSNMSACDCQAWALKNIIFFIIQKVECFTTDSVSTMQEKKANLFNSIIKTMSERGVNFATNVKNIVESTTMNLDNMLKQLVKLTCVSLSYYEEPRKFIDMPDLCKDLNPEKATPINKLPLLPILEKMKMTKFYPGKLSLQDVLKMNEHQFVEPSSFSELPWAMLRKIIAINFDFREKTLHDLLRKLSSQSNTEKSNAPPKRQLISSRKAKSSTNEQHHPTDVFLALFQCFDPFLKRLVAQKLQFCQVAMPLVYHDYETNLLRFSLWPIREIFIDGGSESVATKEIQTLAFIRIGDNRTCSKSKLINQFLREQNDEHSTFFHKDCLLGYLKRDFASGTIEVSWYIPKPRTKNDDSGNNAENEKTIEWALTILNLRGDAFFYPEQLQFLLNFANALVVSIDYDDMRCEKYFPVLAKIHASDAHVIIVTSLPHDEDETEQFIQMYQEKTNLSHDKSSIISTTSEGRHLNEIEVKQFLIDDVYNALQTKTLSMSLEEMSDQLPPTFYSDEVISKSLLGKQLCDQIISQIKGNNWQRTLEKKDILPLQGEALWHEWSKEQKEERRTGKKERFDPNEPHMEKMRVLRLKQICISEQISDTMAIFVDILVTFINDKQTTLFFLSWLRQYMDSRSRIILPNVLGRLRQAFHEFESIRSGKGAEYTPEEEKELSKLKAKISEEERNLAHSSFGLEHFFREMGQLYEAFIYCKNDISCHISTKTVNVIALLPKVATELLFLGQPLEVMDGDAANVPLKWINAVFGEISKKIGKDKRLFAISVLGIQSSGKSTLLNTMFGLQFAVSAGRCTRGIFIQLVPIDKNRSSLKFDYAMVIDTEGLRAPELAGEKVNHDNELATLVIGMGDVAIINIKGETIADMEDVLQIVVHALIRLKQANEKITLKQSCVFVHQNVSAQDADKLTIQGNQKIVQNLDKMTVEVAKEEHVANIRSFQDVIGFNPIKHVKYIPDLWHGSPPMAPASSQYSASVVEVAKCIFKDLTSNQTHSYLSVANTSQHLQSLWNGIMSENFVFSFRNVLEVKAYSLLEKKFQELTWKLEEMKLKWLNDSVRPKLRQCTSNSELSNQERNIYDEFSKQISEETKKITEELERFFKESDLSEHMVHWKGQKNVELESTSRGIVEDVKQKLKAEKEQCNALLESNNRIQKNQETIQVKATEFAKTLKGSTKTPSEQEIVLQFDKAWKHWVDEIVKENPERDVKYDIVDMKSHIVTLLYERFRKYDVLVQNGLKKIPIDAWEISDVLANTMRINDIKQKHISIHTKWGKFKDLISFENYGERAYHFINTIFKRIDVYVQSLQAHTEYDPTIFSQIIKFVTDAFQEHFCDSAKHEYTMTPPLEMMVVLHVARFSVHRFTKMIKAYRLKNSLRSRMESSRPKTEALFIGICTAKANEVIFSNVFCLEMKPLLQEKVERELSVHIPAEILSHFEYRKYPLMKSILKDLAEKENFENYMQYISSPESYTRTWVTDFTKAWFNKRIEGGNTPYTKFAIDILKKMVREIKSSAEMASTSPSAPTSVANWITKFCSNMKNNSLDFPRDPFKSIKYLGINNFKDLSTLINDRIDEIQDELAKDMQKSNIESVSWKDPSPYQVIMDNLWGCPQACPWCKEPCSTASKEDNHDHRCIQHRPQGVNGVYWTKSRNLVLECCNYLITSDSTVTCGNWCNCLSKDSSVKHPYNNYKTYMPKWDITPSSEISKYWTWFVGNYGEKLADRYKIILPAIPSEWRGRKKSDAILSLSKSN